MLGHVTIRCVASVWLMCCCWAVGPTFPRTPTSDLCCTALCTERCTDGCTGNSSRTSLEPVRKPVLNRSATRTHASHSYVEACSSFYVLLMLHLPCFCSGPREYTTTCQHKSITGYGTGCAAAVLNCFQEQQQNTAELSTIGTAARCCCLPLYVHRIAQRGLRRPLRMPSECILNAFHLTCGKNPKRRLPDIPLRPWIRIGYPLWPEHALSLHRARERLHQDVFSRSEWYGLASVWKWGISNR